MALPPWEDDGQDDALDRRMREPLPSDVAAAERTRALMSREDEPMPPPPPARRAPEPEPLESSAPVSRPLPDIADVAVRMPGGAGLPLAEQDAPSPGEAIPTKPSWSGPAPNPGFVADGQPYQPPPDAAARAYEDIEASGAETFGAQITQASPLSWLGRAVERGTQAGSSGFDQFLGHMGEGEAASAGVVPNAAGEPVQSRMLTADEANEKYAPEGTKITDGPIPDGLAQIIGRQKSEEIRRNAIIQRFQNNNAWPINTGVGIAAFMLDPLNIATSYVPGLGEATTMAAVGRIGMTGLAARMVARGVAGGTAMAAQQIPLTAMDMALGREQASDYGMRDALTSVFYGAVFGAAWHAGFGGLREAGLLRPDHLMAPDLRPALEPPAAGPTMPAGEPLGRAQAGVEAGRGVEAETARGGVEAGPVPADVALGHGGDMSPDVSSVVLPAHARADAMRVAVAEVLDERPVDVTQVVEQAQAQKPRQAVTVVPAVAQGEVIGHGDLWRLPPEQIEAMLAEKGASDREKLVRALGSEQAADEFTRLDRMRNSSNPQRADEGSRQFDARFGKLTAEQERLVYGIGDTGAQADDLRTIRDAHNARTTDPTDAGYEAAIAIRSVPAAEIMAVPHGNASPRAQAAYLRLMHAFEDMRAAGVPSDRIAETIARALVERGGWSPGDAAEIVGSFVEHVRAHSTPADVSAQQADHARNGHVTGIPDKDLRETTAAIYGPAEEHPPAGPKAEATGAREPTVETPAPTRPADYGANNKLVTIADTDAIRARLRAKASQLRSGIDPELMLDGARLAVFHIEAGSRAFADYAREMIADIGTEAQPYLRSWYEAARHWPGLDAGGLSSAEEIEAGADRGPARGAATTGQRLVSAADADVLRARLRAKAEQLRTGIAPADPEMEAAERALAEIAPDLSDEDRAEIEAATAAVAEADQHAAAYREAATCLRAA